MVYFYAIHCNAVIPSAARDPSFSLRRDRLGRGAAVGGEQARLAGLGGSHVLLLHVAEAAHGLGHRGDLHRQHPVNVFMLPVLQRHDHAALEVFIYQTGTLVDEYTRQARGCADHWREAAHLSDMALRQRVWFPALAEILEDLGAVAAA